VATSGYGVIYTSTNSGLTWQTNNVPKNYWTSVASSSDGKHLVATIGQSGGTVKGPIYTSSDSGATWIASASAPITNWLCVASSADGTRLVAGAAGSTGGQLYTSVNSGATWASCPGAPSTNWQAVASSANGSNLVAVVFEGLIYTSADAGATWQARFPASDNWGIYDLWSSVASSADGTKLVAVAGGQVNERTIWTSTDSGVSWTERRYTNYWSGVASSTDGTRLVACTYNGQKVYTSTNSGVTWTLQFTAPSGSYNLAVASSADGTRLLMGTSTGGIYISQPAFSFTTTVGTSGSLVGGMLSAAELQYIGNNQFMLLSHEGTLYSY